MNDGISLLTVFFFSVQYLDMATGQKAQLSPLELTALSLSVLAAGSGPLLLGGKITEFLAPASAACTYLL